MHSCLNFEMHSSDHQPGRKLSDMVPGIQRTLNKYQISFSHEGVALFEAPVGEYKEIQGTDPAFKELSDVTTFSYEFNPPERRKRHPDPSPLGCSLSER